MKRRYNYLSHMVDSTTDSVARVAKISAFWATSSQAIVFINLMLYLGAGVISPITLVLLSFLFWCSVFGIATITQLSWIAHLVFNGMEEEESDFEQSPYPTPTTTTKHYVLDGNGYKISKIVERVGGSNEELAELDE